LIESPRARSIMIAMRILPAAIAVLVGFIGGAMLLLALTVSLLRPVVCEPRHREAPVEALAPGATAWTIVPASRWEDAASVADGLAVPRELRYEVAHWVPTSDHSALAVFHHDRCLILVMPERTPLPALPATPGTCHSVDVAAFDDGTVVAMQHTMSTTMLVLAPSATEWTPAPSPPVGLGGHLVATGDRLAYGGDGRRLAVYEAGAWRELPAHVVSRYAFQTRLLADGTVLVAGGAVDEPAAVGIAFDLLPLAALGVLLVLLRLAWRRWPTHAVPAAIGFVLCLLLAGVAFLGLLPQLAWR
jgi:hypothetical protein